MRYARTPLESGELFHTTAGTVRIERPLPRGSTDRYLVDLDGRRCVLRLSSATEHGVSFDEAVAERDDTADDAPGGTGLEVMSFRILRAIGVPVPELLGYDLAAQYLVREFIDGPDGAELIAAGMVQEDMLAQLRHLAALCGRARVGISLNPGHFALRGGQLVCLRYALETHGIDIARALARWNGERHSDTTPGEPR